MPMNPIHSCDSNGREPKVARGLLGLLASKVCARRNYYGVQVGCIIGRIAEFDLIRPPVQLHLNYSAGWRAKAVTVQDELLRSISIDRDVERPLTLRHVIDLHLVGSGNRYIHFVKSNGTLWVAAQVAHCG